MILKAVRLSNFRSFSKQSDIRFKTGHGFCLITGLNEVNPELGANGAGKSTIPEAITWALYGKTSRGLKGTDLCPWDVEGGCLVSVDFEVYGNQYTLNRGWGPTVFTLRKEEEDSRTVTQNEIDALLGISYTAWMNAVFISQFTSFFFDQTPSTKLSMFSEALQLDKWVTASEKAKDSVKRVEAEIYTSNNRCTFLETQIERTKSTITRIEDEIDEFNSVNLKEKKELQTSIEAKKKELVEFEAEEAEITQEVTPLVAKFREHESKFQGIQRAYREVELSFSRLSGKLDYFPKAYQSIEDRKARLETDSICGTCGQKIPESKVLKAKAALNSERSDLQQKETELRNEIEAVSKKLEEVKQTQLQVEADFKQSKSTYEARAVFVQGAAQVIKETKRDLLELERRLAACEKIKCPGEETLVTLRSEQLASEVELVQEKAKKQPLETKLDCTSFWVKGFKDLRLWLISKALKQFELEVNGILPQLGLQGWMITFEIERETTTGSINRGFHVFVKSPGSAKPVAWESWSGGETQRLRIAGVVALKNIIKAYSRFSCNIEFWDEPTQHLSEVGIFDLLRFLEQRSKQENIQTWLIDHRSLQHGFDEEITVVKGLKGSKIVSGRL